MTDLTNKRKRKEEMEGEIGNLAKENALLTAKVKKLKEENKSLQEGEANVKAKVRELESRKNDLTIAVISNMKRQNARVEVNKAEESGLGKKKDDTPVFNFATPPKVGGLDVKSIGETQSKTELGKASETNLNKGLKDDWMSASFKAWKASDARNRQNYFSKVIFDLFAAGQVMAILRN